MAPLSGLDHSWVGTKFWTQSAALAGAAGPKPARATSASRMTRAKQPRVRRMENPRITSLSITTQPVAGDETDSGAGRAVLRDARAAGLLVKRWRPADPDEPEATV